MILYCKEYIDLAQNSQRRNKAYSPHSLRCGYDAALLPVRTDGYEMESDLMWIFRKMSVPASNRIEKSAFIP